MSDSIVIQDLNGFGYRELDLAAKLLKALKDQAVDFLGQGVRLCFNTVSGNVFLCDEDYNVAMMDGVRLEQWFVCPECGDEGFVTDMGFDLETGICKKCREADK